MSDRSGRGGETNLACFDQLDGLDDVDGCDNFDCFIHQFCFMCSKNTFHKVPKVVCFGISPTSIEFSTRQVHKASVSSDNQISRQKYAVHKRHVSLYHTRHVLFLFFDINLLVHLTFNVLQRRPSTSCVLIFCRERDFPKKRRRSILYIETFFQASFLAQERIFKFFS